VTDKGFMSFPTAPTHSGCRNGDEAQAPSDLGLSSVEYVVVLVLVAAISIGSWHAFGARVLCAGREATGAFAAIGSPAGTQTDCSEESGGRPPSSPPEPRVKRKVH
jgi:hypothetical protein